MKFLILKSLLFLLIFFDTGVIAKRKMSLPLGLEWNKTQEILTPKRAKEAQGLASRGLSYAKLGDFEAAENYLKKALRISGENYKFYLYLGQVYFQEKKFYLAEDNFTTAFLKMPYDKRNINALIDVYIAMEKYKKAEVACESLPLIYKSKYYYYIKRAEIFQKSKNYSKEFSSYKKAQKLQKKIKKTETYFFDADLGLYFFYKNKKNISKALKVLEKIKQKKSEHLSQSRDLLSSNFYQGTDFKKYIDNLILDTKFDMYKEKLLVALKKKQLLKYKTDWILKELEKLKPQSSKYFYLVALVEYQVNNNFVKALSLADKASQIDPFYSDPYLLKSKILAKTGDWVIAYRLLKKAEFYNPQSIDVKKEFITLMKLSKSIYLKQIALQKLFRRADNNLKSQYFNDFVLSYYKRGQYIKAYDLYKESKKHIPLKLRNKRDFQYAFNNIEKLSYIDSVKYFKSIAFGNKNLILNGIVKSFLSANKVLLAQRYLVSYLKKNKDIPIYNLELCLKVYDLSKKKKIFQKKDFISFTKLIGNRYGGPLKLSYYVSSLLGSLPALDYLGVSINEKSLKEKIDYSILNPTDTTSLQKKTYISRLLKIINKKIVYGENLIKKNKLKDQEIKNNFILTNDQTSTKIVHSKTIYLKRLSKSYQSLLTRFENEKEKYFLYYYQLEINEFLKAFSVKDIALVEKKITDIKKTLYLFYPTKKNKILDSFYFIEQRDFLKDIEYIKKIELSEDNKSKMKDIGEVLKKYQEYSYFYDKTIEFYFERDEAYKAYLTALKYIKLFSSNSRGYYYLASYYFTTKNIPFAIKYIKKAIFLDKRNEKYYYLYSQIKILNKNYQDAYRIILKGKRLCQTISLLTLAEGSLFFKKQKYKDSLLIYRSLLKKSPTEVRYLHNAGLSCLKLRRYQDAIFYFDRSLFYSSETGVSAYYLANAYYGLKNYKKSQKILVDLLYYFPSNPKYYYALGRVYENLMKVGDLKEYNFYRDQAKAMYREVLTRARFYNLVYHQSKKRLSVLNEKYFKRSEFRFASTVSKECFVHQKKSVFYYLVGLDNSKLVYFNATLKKIKWELKLDSPLSTKISFRNDVFVLGTKQGFVYEIGADTGEIYSVFRTAKGMDHRAVFFDEYGYLFSTKEGLVYTISDGKVKNILRPGASLSSELTYSHDKMYLGLNNATIKSYDLYNGKEYWSYKLRSGVQGNMSVVNKKLFFGVSDLNFYSLTLKGKPLFIYQNPGNPTFSSRVINNKILYSTSMGRIRLIDDEANFYWEFQGQSTLSVVPGFQNGYVLLGFDNAELSVLDYKSGEEKMTLKLNSSAIAEPVFVEKDLLCVLSRDGILTRFYLNWN